MDVNHIMEAVDYKVYYGGIWFLIGYAVPMYYNIPCILLGLGNLFAYYSGKKFGG